jgi:uncharacterized membrane protein YcaP (DUF421 family)
MESVIRGVVIYALLFLIFRIAGKRTLAQTSPFELVLLLIISETTQQAMVDSDHSLTNAVLLIVTLVAVSVLLSVVKHYSPAASQWLEGAPVRVQRGGDWDQEVADKARVDEYEVLSAARATQGISRLEDIDEATIENDGKISVVPRKGAGS